MSYYTDATWSGLSAIAQSRADALLKLSADALESYRRWQAFRDNRTNAQIATDLGKTEGEIANLDAAYSVFSNLKDFLDNAAVSTQDRAYSLRKFAV